MSNLLIKIFTLIILYTKNKIKDILLSEINFNLEVYVLMKVQFFH